MLSSRFRSVNSLHQSDRVYVCTERRPPARLTLSPAIRRTWTNVFHPKQLLEA